MLPYKLFVMTVSHRLSLIKIIVTLTLPIALLQVGSTVNVDQSFNHRNVLYLNVRRYLPWNHNGIIVMII